MAWLYLAFNPVASCPLASELLLIGAFLLAQFGNHTPLDRDIILTARGIGTGPLTAVALHRPAASSPD